MDLPKIYLSSFPDLPDMLGMFGSLVETPGHDDSIVILATYLYEIMPPETLF